jgi:sporulation protein YlmC with PRC-barrel domain
MTTPSGHTRAISAARVKGTTVYNTAGESIGHVEDVILDKMSDKIMFAALGFGGFLGIGEKYHAIPWAMLDYDKEKGGYVVAMSKEALKAAPVYDLSDLLKDDGAIGRHVDAYYGRKAA